MIALPEQPQLAGIVKGLARPGDYVVCLGAGNITQWAYSLAGELKALPTMSFPDIVPDLKAQGAEAARPAAAESVAGRAHLVSRRRAGAGAVHAGGRG